MPLRIRKTARKLLLALLLSSSAGAARAEWISNYGTPGLIDMPSATVSRDGTLTFSAITQKDAWRLQTQFQITPRLSGIFRYSYFGDFLGPAAPLPDLYDRSFDLHYLLREESPGLPAIAIGLRDFGGTGVLGSEYVVATKHLSPRLTVTGGIGWGRLASRGGFSNPLGVISDRFKTRTQRNVGTGRVAFGNFFRGDAALFGGLEYQLNDRTRLVAEYSSDAYAEEVARMGYKDRSPINLGIDYRARPNLTLSAYTLGGAQIGARLSYVIDPRAPRYPGGIERGAAPILPRAQIAALGWSEADIDSTRTRLAAALEAQGLGLDSYEQRGDTARIVLRNPRYGAAPEAIGRAARAMANSLPPGIETYQITLTAQGVPASTTTLRRSDLAQLEHAWDGSWQSFVRADISDAVPGYTPLPGAFPRLDGVITPYFSPSYFDPDAPLRADLGLQAAGTLSFAPGLSLSANVRQKLVGKLDQSTRPSTSILPHVRSDQWLYDKAKGPVVNRLTADYLFRPGANLYGRVSAGYLERMFAGISGELLWYPQGSRLALGAELNHVGQREPTSRFGLGDYRVTTGHVSAYYDFGKGYLGQVDLGRYLAGDWGATVSFEREFDNGFKVGAFFTLTDVSFDDFGEGSFDKGIRFTIPISWLTGEPSKGGFSQTIRPIQRDGGARLNISNRLYGEVRSANAARLEQQWGKFWR